MSDRDTAERIEYVLRQKQVAFGREDEVAAAIVAYLNLDGESADL